MDQSNGSKVTVKLERRHYRFACFGTSCELTILCRTADAGDDFVASAADWLRDFEARFSRYRSDSLVSAINRRAGGGWTETDADLEALLDLAEDARERTCGAVDITALPLYELWHQASELPPTMRAINRTLADVGPEQVQREPGYIRLRDSGAGLDFGGIAKEYAVDRIAGRELPEGVEGMLVTIGGDLRAKGAIPAGGWHVGIEAMDPEDRCAHLRLQCGAVATSGLGRRGSERNGRYVPHLIDPRTGYPASGPALVTVFASTCFEAGIHATTACLQSTGVGAHRWLKESGRRGLVLDPESNS